MRDKPKYSEACMCVNDTWCLLKKLKQLNDTSSFGKYEEYDGKGYRNEENNFSIQPWQTGISTFNWTKKKERAWIVQEKHTQQTSLICVLIQMNAIHISRGMLHCTTFL